MKKDDPVALSETMLAFEKLVSEGNFSDELINALDAHSQDLDLAQMNTLMSVVRAAKRQIDAKNSIVEAVHEPVGYGEQISSDEAYNRLKLLIGPCIHPEVRADLDSISKHCSTNRDVLGPMQGLILYVEQLERAVRDTKLLCVGRPGISLGLNEVSDFARTVRGFSKSLDNCTITCTDPDTYNEVHQKFMNELNAMTRKLSVMERLSNIDSSVLDKSQMKHYRALIDSFNR